MITLYTGPMFSGKTTRLISSLQRYIISKKRCLFVRYENDDRVSTTHDNLNHEVDCDIIYLGRDSLRDVFKVQSKYEVVAIDEAQFYDHLDSVCIKLRASGKIVVVSGLIGTYKAQMFSSIADLMPHADKVKKMNAICIKCGRDAIYSVRREDSRADLELGTGPDLELGTGPDLELIGGTESYMALCHNCWKL